MARFKFRLEPVLKMRKRIEQDRQRELALRESKLVELQNELKRMDSTLQSTAEELRKNHLTGRIDLGFLTAHRRFLGAMQRQGIEVAQKIAAQQLKVNEARAHLAEAAKHRKAIEKLRERQLERWQQDQSRRELADLDEIGTQIGYKNLTDAEI